MAKIILKKNEERRLLNGHQWIFSNEIQNVEENPENGELVDIYDSRNNFLGKGFYNKNSLIACRFIANQKEINLEDLFKERLLRAFQLRKDFYPNRNSFRLVFSESDFIPGLIIDKYNDTYVLQVYSYGTEKNINSVVQALKEEFNAKNIFTQNEEYLRRLEGLPEGNSIYAGAKEIEIIEDGHIKYKINFERTQKTGFFFDQSDNRIFISKICKDKNVLDAFCNSGGFGLHAAFVGASNVTLVDSSSTEIENAKENFELNKLNTPAEFITSDVFDYLQNCKLTNKKFDIVMIDPPAFAKNKKSLPTAKKGYEKLNRLALEVLNPDGYLITSSCSHHLAEDEFLEIINRAAIKVGKTIQLVHFNNASLDHPQLLSMPETVYLKFAVFRMNS